MELEWSEAPTSNSNSGAPFHSISTSSIYVEFHSQFDLEFQIQVHCGMGMGWNANECVALSVL